MPVNIGPKIGIEGEAEYRRQLNNIITQTKTLHAEMRSLESGFNSETSAVKKAAQQKEMLNRQIAIQEQEVEKLRIAVQESSDKYGENSDKTLRWRQALANAETELHNLQNRLKEIPNNMQLMGQAMQRAGDKIKSVGQTTTNVGRDMTRYITTPILAIGTAAVKTTADFDTSMSKVSAISGATGDDFDALRSKAREMGATTKFTAEEAGDAMTYMAMAGWKTEDMLNGVEGIMYLAAASGEDLATTSDIVTDALTAFGHSAEDSGRLADIMAAASSNANTNVGLMGETFKYVAPVAGALGMSMEDTAVAIGLMANAGIKGSMAGTSMRNILTRMAKPTKESQTAMDALGISLTNADGSMKSLEEIMQDMRVGFSGLTEAEQAQYAAMLAGQRGMSGLLAIVNAAPEDYEKLRLAVDNSTGSAKAMAETMQDNLAGQLTILKSQLQELAISFGDLLVPHIRKAVEWVQKQVDAFNAMDDSSREQIIKMGLLAAAIGPVVTVVGKLTSGVGSLVKGGGKLLEIMGNGGVLGAFTALGTSIGIMTGVTVTLGAAANALYNKYVDVNGAMYKTNEAFREQTSNASDARRELESSTASMSSMITQMDGTVNSALATSELAKNIGNELAGLADQSSRTSEEQERMKLLVDQLNSIYPELGLSIDSTTGSLNKGTAEINNYINEMSRITEVQAYQEAYKAIVDEIVEAESSRIQAELELQQLEESTSSTVQKYANSTALLGTEQGKAGKEIQNTKTAIEEYANTSEAAQEKLQLYQQRMQELGIDITGVTDATDASTASATTANEAYDALGDASLTTAGEISTASEEMVSAYEEAYNAALESLQGQSSLYEEFAETESVSYETIMDNMNKHIEAMQSWNQDVLTLTNDTRYGTDEVYTAMIDDIVSLGEDHAEVVHAYAEQYRNSSGDLSAAAENWAKKTDVSEQYADIMANNQVSIQNGMDAAVDTVEAGATEIENSLDGTVTTATNDGAAVPNSFAQGVAVNSYRPKVEVSNMAGDIGTRLSTLASEASTYGEHFASNFAWGMQSGNAVSSVRNSAITLANIAHSYLGHTTPDKGPLKDDDTWGYHFVQNLAQGMNKGRRLVTVAAEKVGVAAEMGVSEAMVDPAVVSGRAGLGATIQHVIGGGLDPAAIYAAVREGAAAAETSVVIGEREFMRILRDAGVAMA